MCTYFQFLFCFGVLLAEAAQALVFSLELLHLPFSALLRISGILLAPPQSLYLFLVKKKNMLVYVIAIVVTRCMQPPRTSPLVLPTLLMKPYLCRNT